MLGKFILWIRVWNLKRIARMHFKRAHTLKMMSDGGYFITGVLYGGEIEMHLKKYRECMDELSEIDHNFPK